MPAIATLVSFPPALRFFALALVLAVALGTSSCDTLGGGSAANQFMVVGDDPKPTFGFTRLRLHEDRYPELKTFLGKNGDPDILFETRESTRDYFILYYLDRETGYAFRTRGAASPELEFSGAQTLGDDEVQFLRLARKFSLSEPPGRVPGANVKTP